MLQAPHARRRRCVPTRVSRSRTSRPPRERSTARLSPGRGVCGARQSKKISTQIQEDARRYTPMDLRPARPSAATIQGRAWRAVRLSPVQSHPRACAFHTFLAANRTVPRARPLPVRATPMPSGANCSSLPPSGLPASGDRQNPTFWSSANPAAAQRAGKTSCICTGQPAADGRLPTRRQDPLHLSPPTRTHARLDLGRRSPPEWPVARSCQYRRPIPCFLENLPSATLPRCG